MAKTKGDGPSGLVVTSHDVVSKLRWIAGTRRVGHAGTLDPAATGVLILGLNKATKLLTYLVGQDKTYQATIQLGISTETDDAQGRQTGTCPEAVEALTEQRILEAVASLTGDIMQVPSAVSAIKVNGVRSYTRVRGGEQVELAARPVRVNEFTVHSIQRTMTSWCVLVSQQELAEAGIDVAGTHGELSDPTTAITSVPVIRHLYSCLGAGSGSDAGHRRAPHTFTPHPGGRNHPCRRRCFAGTAGTPADGGATVDGYAAAEFRGGCAPSL